MKMLLRMTTTMICLTALGGSLASGQETLPIPKRSVPAAPAIPATPEEEPLEEAAEPVVVGNLEHQGWALAGPRGRHYFFGGLAVADYVYQGERRIVTLQQEEPTLLPKPDKNFLYYRELESGHRWAVGREPLPSGSYVIFYQRKGSATEPGDSTAPSAEPKKAWQEFQRSRLEWKKPAAAADSKWTPRTKGTVLDGGKR
jgi:hypothetical protein